MRPNQTNRLVLAVKESTTLEFRLAAHVDAQLAQHRLISRRDDNAKEGVAATELLQARKDTGGSLARSRGDRQRHKRLVGMEARVFATQEMRLELADGLDRLVADDFEL